MSNFEIIDNTKEAEDKYCRCYGSNIYRKNVLLSRGDIEALLNGKQLATDDRSVYNLCSFRGI